MQLSDIFPSKVSFRLSQIDQDLIINHMTLEDAVFLQEKFGDNLNNIGAKEFCIIVARMLDNNSRKLIGSAKIIEVDDYGNEQELKLTIAEKILKLATDYELMIMIDAIMETRKRSNIMIDKIKNGSVSENGDSNTEGK